MRFLKQRKAFLYSRKHFHTFFSLLCNFLFPSQYLHGVSSLTLKGWFYRSFLSDHRWPSADIIELWPASVICSHKIHMLNSAGVCSRGKWIIYKNLSWHLLSNVERWRQNSCYCCRKQSAGDWIKVSRKWLLDGLLFSLIQLDVSLSCQLGITAVWFINRLSDLLF